MSSFGDMRASVQSALFALLLFFTFAVGIQNAGAQVVQGPPPSWLTPADANALLIVEMEDVQADLNVLPPGPLATALSQKLQLYDLIQANIGQLNKVGDAVYASFGMQFGQQPVVYANGNNPPSNLDADAANPVTYTPQLDDAIAPNPSAPNYGSILSLYEEVSERLSY